MSEVNPTLQCSAVPAYIRALPRYVPGRSEQSVAPEYGLTRIVKLASNENPLGCSPHVAKVIKEQLGRGETALARYPDSEAFELRHALAHHHGVPPECIAITNGSHELIDLCAALTLHIGNAGLYSQYAFQAYPISIQARGATAIEVPAREYRHDTDAICSAMSNATRLVYLCNPNNPTGTVLTPTDIVRILDAAGSSTLVVLDEAYIDYLDPALRPDSVGLVARYPRERSRRHMGLRRCVSAMGSCIRRWSMPSRVSVRRSASMRWHSARLWARSQTRRSCKARRG
jgi:histidinol-phosphate aminotransferase